MVRKLQKLARYRFTLRHISGKENEVSDFLSRYVHKRRHMDQATQVDETTTEAADTALCSESSCPQQAAQTTLNVNIVDKTAVTDSDAHKTTTVQNTVTDEPISEELVPDTNPLIPTSLFDPDSESTPSIKHKKHSTIDLLEQDRVTDVSSCLCDLKLLPQNNMEVDKLHTVDAGVNAVQHVLTAQVTPVEPPMAQNLNMIREAQEKDPILCEVKKWITAGQKPKKIQALRTPPDLIRYWRRFNLITLRDDLLVKKWIKHNKETKEIEIERYVYLTPDSIQEQIMALGHNTLITIHPGVEESVRQCQKHYYWPKMREDLELYVAACTTCGKAKPPRAYLKAALKHVVVHDFNDAISIDHVVPERDGKTKRGHRYILSITDVFTGYLVAVPCKTKESEETIRLINHHWCSNKGYPLEILADNDGSFTSKFYNAVLKAFNIKSTHGTAYKCSTTSKAERSNRRINNALRITLTDKQLTDWDLYLRWVCFALNSLKSRHTGYSPNKLLYGRELRTPLTIMIDNEPVNLDCANAHNAKAYQLHKTIKDIVNKARRHAVTDFKYADNTYNRHLHGPYFSEGQWCYVLINCPQHKFSSRWRGPYRVAKVINEHLYVIDMENGEKVCNITKLKHYKISKYSPPALLEANNKLPAVARAQPATTDEGSQIEVEIEILPNIHDPTPAPATLAAPLPIQAAPQTAPLNPTAQVFTPQPSEIVAAEPATPALQYPDPIPRTAMAPDDSILHPPEAPVPPPRRSRRNRIQTRQFQAGF